MPRFKHLNVQTHLATSTAVETLNMQLAVAKMKLYSEQHGPMELSGGGCTHTARVMQTYQSQRPAAPPAAEAPPTAADAPPPPEAPPAAAQALPKTGSPLPQGQVSDQEDHQQASNQYTYARAMYPSLPTNMVSTRDRHGSISTAPRVGRARSMIA